MQPGAYSYLRLLAAQLALLLLCCDCAAEAPVPLYLELALPDDRRTSATESILLGGATDSRSSQAAPQGTSLLLDDAQRMQDPVPPPLYALYRFNVADSVPSAVDIQFTPGQTSGPWVGLVDYSKQRWVWSGNFETDFTLPVTVLVDPAVNVSPAGNIYVAILTKVHIPGRSAGGVALIEQLTLHENKLPVLQLDALPPSGTAPLLVQFDASASADPDGTLFAFRWDFDSDGMMDLETQPSTSVQHEFTTPGVYVVELTALDDEGASSTVTTTVTVNAP